MGIKKVLAIFAAGILLWFALSFINAFAGNPVSKALVNQAAEKYVEQNYSTLNLTLDKANYNFKDGKYNVYVKSKTSIDTHFSISFTGTGKFSYDNYEDVVLSKWNTFQRIDTAYRELVDTVLETKDFPYISEIAFGEIADKDDYDYDKLEIDKEYDINKIGEEKGHIVLYVTSETLDAETLSQILFQVRNLFDRKEIPFYSINLTLQTPLSEDKSGRESIAIQKFLYQDIYQEGLINRIEENINSTKKYYEQRDKEKEAESNEQNT